MSTVATVAVATVATVAVRISTTEKICRRHYWRRTKEVNKSRKNGQVPERLLKGDVLSIYVD